MKKGSFSIFAAVFALMLVSANAFAATDYFPKPGLSVSVGGDSLGYKVKTEFGDEGTDVGVAGGYAGAEYSGRVGNVLYAAGLGLGGAVVKAENAMSDNTHLSGAAPYATATLKMGYAITEALKTGITSSYTWISQATGEASEGIFYEKIKLGPTSLIAVNAIAQYTVMKDLDIYGGYSAQLVDMSRAKIEAGATGLGSFRDTVNLDPINTSGGLLGAVYSMGKYDVSLQGALRANNASSITGAISYRF